MPYNNTGYQYRQGAGMGLGQGIRTGGFNDQRYSNNGNPNGAYNQRSDLGRYRPPTIQTTNNGVSNWNDQGGYEYNIPNSYGSPGNYFDPYQRNRNQYGGGDNVAEVQGGGEEYWREREARRPFQQQQPQAYQRGQLQGAFQQAQQQARNPNMQRPPTWGSDTGGGYGERERMAMSGIYGANPEYFGDPSMLDSARNYFLSNGPQTPRFQGANGWRPNPNDGLRMGIPRGEMGGGPGYDPQPLDAGDYGTRPPTVKPTPISDEDYGTRPPLTKPAPLGGPPQDGARPPVYTRPPAPRWGGGSEGPRLGGYGGGIGGGGSGMWSRGLTPPRMPF